LHAPKDSTKARLVSNLISMFIFQPNIIFQQLGCG
jgi:hypothetical protein